MQGASRLFIAAGLFYLAGGTAIGLLMAFKGGKWVLRMLPSHAHINLFGWVSMLIFGFAYYLLPAVAGKELYSQTLPYLHFILGNAGLLGMASSWALSRFPNSPISPRLVWPFGILVVLSVWLFIFNIAMTLFF